MTLGADPFLVSTDGRNSFHWATRIGNKKILETLVDNIPSSDIIKMLNTPIRDGFGMKLIHIAARFNNTSLFEYIMTLEQKNRDTCIHNTYPPDENGEKEFKHFWKKCFANNNIYTPNSKGDTILHIIVRFGATRVYYALLGILLKTLKRWNARLGPIDYEKEGLNKDFLNDDDTDDEEPSPEFSQGFYDYLTVDGDIASTDDSEEEKPLEEDKKEENR